MIYTENYYVRTNHKLIIILWGVKVKGFYLLLYLMELRTVSLSLTWYAFSTIIVCSKHVLYSGSSAWTWLQISLLKKPMFYRGNKIWVRVKCVWIKSRVRDFRLLFFSRQKDIILLRSSNTLHHNVLSIAILRKLDIKYPEDKANYKI